MQLFLLLAAHLLKERNIQIGDLGVFADELLGLCIDGHLILIRYFILVQGMGFQPNEGIGAACDIRLFAVRQYAIHQIGFGSVHRGDRSAIFDFDALGHRSGHGFGQLVLPLISKNVALFSKAAVGTTALSLSRTGYSSWSRSLSTFWNQTVSALPPLWLRYQAILPDAKTSALCAAVISSGSVTVPVVEKLALAALLSRK